MNNAEIRAALEAKIDPAYREFSASLVPDTNDMLGVRLPELRRLAKRLARDNPEAYLSSASDASFEERLLQGLVLGYARMDRPARLIALARFLPKVDSWSVCDSACTTCRFVLDEPDFWFDWLAALARRPEEYFARFGLVCLLDHFARLDAEHARRVLAVCADIRHEAYYVRMANAWALAECAVLAPNEVLAILRDGALDDFTRRMTVRKICESYRISDADKARFRALRGLFAAAGRSAAL